MKASNLCDVSFPDCPVHVWQLESTHCRLQIVLQDAFILNEGYLDRPVTLTIGPATFFVGRRYPLNEAEVTVVAPVEPLTEICECELRAMGGWLSGFGRMTGDWLRYEFEGPVDIHWELEDRT